MLIPTPVIGTILGGVAGAFLAVAAVEYRNTRSWRPALRASGAYLAGCLASKVVEGVIAATMLAVFVWRGFFA
ncbi:MAG: DUF456 family protein [Dehalococcoidia bacterium]|nr:DUF456 family protein [Dehalococcoidia bacterium]